VGMGKKRGTGCRTVSGEFSIFDSRFFDSKPDRFTTKTQRH
jgi:hypothetical protein